MTGQDDVAVATIIALSYDQPWQKMGMRVLVFTFLYFLDKLFDIVWSRIL